jgi:RhtB (resistance to homoserine/threonine) family protein
VNDLMGHDMSELFVLAIICFIAMVSPGPDFVLITRNSIIYPRPQAFATAFGIVTGACIHATYCTLGLVVVLTKSIVLFSIVKYAGACYLMYLGLKGLTSKPKQNGLDVHVDKNQSSITVRAAFLQGFLCNILNPKLAIFLVSLFTQFISLDATLGEKSAVAGVFVLESFLYWPFLVFILHLRTVRAAFSRLQVYLDRGCGAVLFALGVRVAVSRE